MNRSVIAFFFVFFALADANDIWRQFESSDVERQAKNAINGVRDAATEVLDDASDWLHGSERLHVDPVVIGAAVAGGLGLLLLIACCACCCCRRSNTPQTIVMTPPSYAQMYP